MRTLFYIGHPIWNGSARAFVSAAQMLGTREHPVTVACCGNSAVERHALETGVDVVRIEPASFFGSDAWGLRRILQERFIEVGFVHTDREQLVVSTALRLAERGAVIRRVPAFTPVELQRSGRFATRAAATGLLFTTEAELKAAQTDSLPIPAAVAPLGVDAAAYDALRPANRAAFGAPANALLVVCVYEPNARAGLFAAMRTVALLAPRHPELHMTVLGRGSEEDALRLHAAALGISQAVSFLGGRDDALGILRAADVGWVAATRDDAAFAFLDFMAMRIPVIAERSVVSQHYVADQIAGILLSPSDASYTASSVAAFLAQDERRAAMGKAGRARVEREFPATAMLEGFERATDAASNRERWAAR
jgi:glycosyltransferase involved in cell wall biosynthesis